MPSGNPDSVTSIHSDNILISEDVDTLTLESGTENPNSGLEDEESTPVLPQTPSSDLNSSVSQLVESNFNQTASRVSY